MDHSKPHDRAVACGRGLELIAELEITSNFTFLTGASHPDELVEQAVLLGYAAIGIADENTVAGVVRGHVAAREYDLQFLPGAAIRLRDTPLRLLLYPESRRGWANLCSLITRGRMRADKGSCHLLLQDVIDLHADMLAIVSDVDGAAMEILRDRFDDDRISLGVRQLYGEDDGAHLISMERVSRAFDMPLVALGDVHYHLPRRRVLQDVLACIRVGCTLEEARHLYPNAERYLKPPEEVRRLFSTVPVAGPGAIERGLAIAERASGFSLDQLRYEYPSVGEHPDTALRTATFAGAARRYGGTVPPRVCSMLEHELSLITELSYAPYFLTVYEVVRFARGRGILCQGRGAAANSAVCYCLGMTEVDPERSNLLFERFISRERGEPPDIDIDFEHERREEVIQHIYERYGRDRAALTAVIITYRWRSAIRDVGKALGLSLDCVEKLAKSVDWWTVRTARPRVEEAGVREDDPLIAMAVSLATDLLGFPRHLSQHPGGFVITRSPLHELVPIENAAMPMRSVIEWDKDDIDAMGMLKIDVLGLGILSCIRKCMEMVGGGMALASIPPEEIAVYDMLCRADTVGVFQVESRAQMNMLPRLRPRCFYDIVIEIALVRPGPIQGDMVHPYLRRRSGRESIEYPNEDVRHVLERTLGVPLFQEQAMALAMVAGGFTAEEADELRRAMAAWKRRGSRMTHMVEKLVSGMQVRGYEQEFIDRCVRQVHGFSEYGFPESHAASFALLVYASAWLRCHYPAAYAAAILNSQPMGFYAPAQIVRDAADHGVEVRGVDVNYSSWDACLEDGSLRLGMRQVRRLREEEARRIAWAVRKEGRFTTVTALWRASGVRVRSLRHLARADAFGSMGLSRQQAIWSIARFRDAPCPLFDGCEQKDGERSRLPGVHAVDEVARDYASVGLSLRGHPMEFVRGELDASGVQRCEVFGDANRCADGDEVSVAGMVLLRQRPATAKGLIFMTIEDESGSANIMVRPQVYERYRREARHAAVVIVHGRVQREGVVTHLIASRFRTVRGGFPRGTQGRRSRRARS